MNQAIEERTGEAALGAAQAVAEAARDALAQARTRRDDLLVLAAHDIRNAVGIVDSALTMIEDAPELVPSMHAMMRRATHRLGILARALVDVDLLQREAMPLVPTASRWTTIVTPVVEAALPVAATKEITLAPGGDLGCELACDATLLAHTVAALLDHAIGTAPNGSVVDVEGERLGVDRFRVRIAHRGRAIATGALEKYFTTLPLRFARLAAARHGGTLRAVSPLDAGVGVAFELELTA
ncbi:MAG: sensor histidine kinase [Candidatus Binatia bacterium]